MQTMLAQFYQLTLAAQAGLNRFHANRTHRNVSGSRIGKRGQGIFA